MFPLTLAFIVQTNWRGIPLKSNYCGWHSCQASFQFCLSQMLGVFDKCVKTLFYSHTAFPWFVHEKYNFVKHKSNISLITNFCGWRSMYHTYQTQSLLKTLWMIYAMCHAFIAMTDKEQKGSFLALSATKTCLLHKIL